MRALARTFTAYRKWADEKEEVLRELGQPIYRYDVSDQRLLDGAIFAYFDDVWWDPEALLLIEARLKGRQYHWYCAGARITTQPARIEHMGKQIWSVRSIFVGNYRNRTYRTFRAELCKLSAPLIGTDAGAED